jgi:hypothetical protein
MEFLEGENLKTKMSRREPASLEERLDIILQIADGLAHAHSNGVIHRDIKPGNLFVTNSGDVKILDFGLARLAQSGLTGSGQKMRTPSYMSPEQLQSSKVDHRTDIYSAGVVFYELLTFKRLFQGESLNAIFYKIFNSIPEDVEKVNPRIPHELSEVVRRSMEKDPSRRYQKMEEVRNDLRKIRAAQAQRKRIAGAEAKDAIEQLERLILDNSEYLHEAKQRLLQMKEDPPTLLLKLGAGSRAAPGAAQSNIALECPEILEIRDRARREYEKLSALLTRRQHAAALLREASRLEENRQYDEAMRVADQILASDPTWREAQALRGRLSARLEEKRIKEQWDKRAADLLLAAESRLAAGDFLGCIGAAAELLAVDPQHAAAADLSNRAQRELAARAEMTERTRRANDAIAAAHAALAQRKLQQARQSAEKALSLLPGLPEALALLDEIVREEKECQAREDAAQKIARSFAEAKSLQEKGDEDGGIAIADAVLALDPGNAAALRLKARLEEVRSAKKTAGKLYEEAEKKLATQGPAACIPILTMALRLFPAHEGAGALLKRARTLLEEREKKG